MMEFLSINDKFVGWKYKGKDHVSHVPSTVSSSQEIHRKLVKGVNEWTDGKCTLQIFPI